MNINTIADSKLGYSKTALELENDQLKILLVPEIGGKIVKLTRKKTGTQFLKQADTDPSDYPQPEYGEEFLPPHASGFDECFPNVAPSDYSFNGTTVTLPDHGELWNQSWDYECNDKEIIIWTFGKSLDYRFKKHIRLNGSNMEIIYELENLEETPFEYIWSSHPLMEIQPGDELLLSNEISDVLLNWSSDSTLGRLGTKLQWPKIIDDNRNIDFNIVQDKSLGFAVKLYSKRLKTGMAGLYRTQTDESFVLSFDVEQIPFLGIWLCYGGWPESGSKKQYTLALEPCSSRPDSLIKACQWGDQQEISPSTIKSWQLNVQILDGKTNLSS